MARPSNIKREDILDVARPMFIEKGIAATEMTDIAKKCGIGRSSLYRYFGSKESLALALAEEMLDTIIEQLYNGASVQGNGYQAVAASLTALTQAMKEHVGMVRFLDDFDSYFSDRNPPSTAVGLYHVQIGRKSFPLADALRRGVADQSLRPIEDIEFTQRYLINALLAIAQRVLPRAAILRQEQGYAEEYLDEMLSTLLHSINRQK